ncbi:MAG: ShlB/FhaC/HecB family hemolysin secretion/activation protein [Sphingomonadaceae bacterium]
MWAAPLSAQETTGAAPVAPANQPQRAPDTFPIYAIDVTGATRLSAAELERVVYPYTGPDRSNVDVEAARKAIADAYVAKGYEAVIVESPLQQPELFNAGVITIAVTESPVGKVQVVGARFHSEAVIRRQLPSVVEGEPLDFRALQTEFSALDRFADRKVDFVPKAGEVAGTTDVDLVVKDSFPLHATFELNNDSSANTRPLRLSGSARYTDMWKLGHTLQANFILAPQRQSDSSLVAASYTAPILGSPWTLSVNGYRSNSNIAALGGSNVLGKGYQIGVRAGLRLPARDTSQSVGFAVDYKDFEQDVIISGGSVGQTPIRYLPVTVDYSVFGSDADSGFAKKVGNATFGVNASATLGFRVIKRQLCLETTGGLSQVVDRANCGSGPNFEQNDQFTVGGQFSSENFVHFNVGFNYSLATSSDFVATTSWNMQVSSVHLVTNEQFSAGGRSSVRGYLESEAVGDQGFFSTFELAGPSFAPYLGKFVDELRLYAFSDSGYVRTLSVLPGTENTARLLSVGGGARLKVFNRLYGEVLVGWPLVTASSAATATPKGEPRTLFVVRGEF